MISSLPVIERRAIPVSAPETRSREYTLSTLAFAALIAGGIALRVLVAFLPGSADKTSWSGGGDTPAYLLLAKNLLAGRGYAYAGEPTALRAPAYPLLLACSMELFRAHALAAIRWLQFFEGLGVATLCAATARRIFDPVVAKTVFVVALFFPTLIFINGEILTEATATFCSAVFLCLLVRFLDRPGSTLLCFLSATAGAAALIRFNMALLGGVVLAACFLARDRLAIWKSVGLATAVMALVLSPWLVRNESAFGGRVLFSTHSGIEAVEGILTPQGRSVPGDSQLLLTTLGWIAPVEIETNSPSRHQFSSEPVLDARAWHSAWRLWRQQRWRLVPLTLEKFAWFWLSADQLLSTQSFAPEQRFARASAVLVYWCLLALAVMGWVRLRVRSHFLASVFLSFGVVVTLIHIPFVMNTRLRVPFMDPWTAVLAGAGLAAIRAGGKRKRTRVVERCVELAK